MKTLEQNLNTIVPAERGEYGNLVYIIGLMHGCELRLLGTVDEERDQPDGVEAVTRLWAAAKEGHRYSTFVVEWWIERDPQYDTPRPSRIFRVGDSSWPDVPLTDRFHDTDWEFEPWRPWRRFSVTAAVEKILAEHGPSNE